MLIKDGRELVARPSLSLLLFSIQLFLFLSLSLSLSLRSLFLRCCVLRFAPLSRPSLSSLASARNLGVKD